MGALLVIALAYLAGSIPTGVLLGRLAGVDVRSAGSRNIGATNVARTAGRSLGILTLVGDALKGLLPVLVVRAFGFDASVVAMTAVAALCGHVFSIFLGFRGGKGVATGVGVMLGLAPAIAPIPLALFGSPSRLSKIVSLSSIVATVSAAIASRAVRLSIFDGARRCDHRRAHHLPASRERLATARRHRAAVREQKTLTKEASLPRKWSAPNGEILDCEPA